MPRAAVAILGSLVGLALLSGAPAGVDGWRAFGGVAASLLAGAGFALLTLVTARPLAGQHAITCVGLLLGGVLLLPVGVADGMSVPLSASVLGLVIYLGLVPTALAYGAYFIGLRHTHPTAAALATMLEPLTATVLSVGLAGERLGVAGIAGAVLIAVALVVAPR